MYLNLYSADDKAAIGEVITKVYTPLLPTFYVVVLFISVDKADYFVGGKRSNNFVKIAGSFLNGNFRIYSMFLN
jgi:phenylpyruvate tautomerase PptA (4-oxalocrotonate tautomerase family)